MTDIAIIGGTGLARMEGMTVHRREMVKTPFGAPSSPLIHGEYAGRDVVFLARHGHFQHIPPHRINYMANIWALKSVGIAEVVAVAAVGAIEPDIALGAVVVPDQIIDYTNDRGYTFVDGDSDMTDFPVDFNEPYTTALRERLVSAAKGVAGVTLVDSGCYGAIQGPRQETAAERRRMQADGCTVVGMTGMPEAILARELKMDYACCGLVVRQGASIADASAMEGVRAVLRAFLSR